MNDFC